jgi:hypothetical protein
VTGPEHYREAERLLTLADGFDVSDAAVTLAAAHAHATLALAAATALTDAGNAQTTGDGGMPAEDYWAWLQAAGQRHAEAGDG